MQYLSHQLVLDVRTTSAPDPTNPRSKLLSLVPERILTNTLEQLVLFVGGTTILAGHLDSHTVKIIPIVVLMWFIGRMLFAYGCANLVRFFSIAVTVR